MSNDRMLHRPQARNLWRLLRLRLQRVFFSFTDALARTITPIGWFVLAVVLVGVSVGATLHWVEGWFVAIAGALVVLLALPFLLGSRSYSAVIEMSRSYVVAGGHIDATVVIENTSSRPQLPAVIELHVGEALREIPVPFLGAHQRVVLPVTVPAIKRGVIRLGPVTLAKRDPLGLLNRELTWPDRHLLHIHPETTPLPPNTAGLVRDLEGQPSRRLTEADLSFHAVREYAPGDAVRHIHWKSTAKTGALMVRQFEESQTARVAVLFDARPEEYASPEEFELGVSVAASLSVQSVREGRERFVASAWTPGRVRPSIDGLEELPSREPLQLLNSWAELEYAIEGRPFEELARSLADSGRTLSIVAIVTGAHPDTIRLRHAAIAFGPEVHVMGVRCELLAEPKMQKSDSISLCTVGALGDLPQLMIRSGL